MLAPRPCIARCLPSISLKNVRLNSTATEQSGPKRLTASWGDIYIPSRDEINKSKKTPAQTTSLGARLAARKWVRVDNNPSQPLSVQAKTSTSNNTVPSLNIESHLSNSAAAAAVDTSPALANAISPTQHVPPVLHVPISPQPISGQQQNIPASEVVVWNSVLKAARPEEDNYFSGTEAIFSGRQWVSGMARSEKKIGAQRARKNKAKNINHSDKRERRKPAYRDVKAASHVNKSVGVAKVDERAKASLDTSEELYADEDGAVSGGHLPDDDSIIDGISLYGPAAGQTKEEWITDFVIQGRDPEAPEVQSADVQIASDFDDLFRVSSAQVGVAVAAQHAQQSHEPRPGVKQGKVDYQIRRILRKYGGDYSYLQPQVKGTSVERIPPSRLAQFAISRRPEVETRQRKTFMEIVASATSAVGQHNARK